MNCKDCIYNLFDEELNRKCCQFGSVQDRGFNPPCENDLMEDLRMEQKEQM